jgi:hypothetical protein
MHKSTMTPMHVSDALLDEVRDILGYRVDGFPQTYLGLPLLAYKLNFAVFAP